MGSRYPVLGGVAAIRRAVSGRTGLPADEIRPHCSFCARERKPGKPCLRRSTAQAGLPAFRRHLEAGKLEARSHRAADQRPCTQAFRRLPCSGGHHTLRPLTGTEIRAKRQRADALAIIRNPEGKRRPRVPVPGLHRVDPVPGRAFPRLQQEIDRRRARAAISVRQRITEGLDVVARLPDAVSCRAAR